MIRGEAVRHVKQELQRHHLKEQQSMAVEQNDQLIAPQPAEGGTGSVV